MRKIHPHSFVGPVVSAANGIANFLLGWRGRQDTDLFIRDSVFFCVCVFFGYFELNN